MKTVIVVLVIALVIVLAALVVWSWCDAASRADDIMGRE